MGDALRAATVDAWRAVERMRALAEGGVLTVLGERIAALLAEFAWEAGVVDPSVEGIRLDHVGIVVRDLRAAAALYGDLLGGTLVAGGVHEGMGIRSLHFTYAAGGKVELLEPLRPGPVARFLESRGGGPHHLTYFTPDLTTSLDGFAHGGLSVVDVDRSAPEWQEAYLSPHGTQGCLIQVVEGPEVEPVPGLTVDAVLDGEWEWRDHRPRRILSEARR